MSDADTYMALALNNAQGELSPLEVGLHAKGSGLDQKKAGVPRTTLQHQWHAAAVYEAVPHVGHDLSERWRHLAEIHAGPEWLRPALVSALVANEWTVEAARKAAQRVKDIAPPPRLGRRREGRGRCSAKLDSGQETITNRKWDCAGTSIRNGG